MANVDAHDGNIRIGGVLANTYEIVDVLGRGGMGAVYLARHLRLPKKLVAVKLLYGTAARSNDVHARFQKEAEIISRLVHPNIVQVLDYNWLPDGSPFLVLEHLKGESLAARLRRGPMAPNDAVRILRETALALHAAHQAGVVHRDLKPGNIFLVPMSLAGTATDHVKLLDFGISKLTETSFGPPTEDAVLLGTPQYMSPEQALGRNRDIDSRSDIFALGCIAYEILSGHAPFRGASAPEILYHIVHDEPPSLRELCPSLSESVHRSIGRAMAKSRDDRHPDAASFAADIDGSHTTLPLPSSSTPIDDARRIHTPRHRGRAAIIGAVGFGITASLIYVALSWWPRSEGPYEVIAISPPANPNSATPTHQTGRDATIEAPIPAPDAANRQAAVRLDATANRPVDRGPREAPDVTQESDAHEAREAPLDPKAIADLDAADRAFADGAFDEAIRLARKSQRVQTSGRAHAILARAHCALGDLSNARAQYANVPTRLRDAVARECQRRGIDF